MKTAILLMAHGSRIPEANDAVHEIAAMVKEMLGYGIVVLVGRLLALDATLAVPDPPLQRIVPWGALGVFACAFALLAAALVELVLRIAHRRSAAGRGATGETWAS